MWPYSNSESNLGYNGPALFHTPCQIMAGKSLFAQWIPILTFFMELMYWISLGKVQISQENA